MSSEDPQDPSSGTTMESDDKTMVTREWLYTKILDASQKKYYGKLCGLVLAGGQYWIGLFGQAHVISMSRVKTP